MLIRLSAVVVAVLLQLVGVARAKSTGVTEYYGPSNTCMNCHLGQMRKGTIQLTSPAHTGKTYTFSFVCADTTGAGGTLPLAGVNIHASCGTLGPTEPGTKIVNGQLIHTQPRPTANNAKTWQFSWTAPAAPDSCGFTIAGLLGDNDKTSSGDVTCLAMKALLVLPPPDAGPPDLSPTGDSGAQGSEAGATTNDGTPHPSDGAASAEMRVTDGATETDDGCGCRLSARHPARSPAPLLGLLLVLAALRRSSGVAS